MLVLCTFVFVSSQTWPKALILSCDKALQEERLCCLYRRLHQVKATTLQEKDEKVTVEEAFPLKTGAAGTSLSTGEASVVAPWNVKLEQTINIFLTVSFLISYEIYCVSQIAYR